MKSRVCELPPRPCWQSLHAIKDAHGKWKGETGIYILLNERWRQPVDIKDRGFFIWRKPMWSVVGEMEEITDPDEEVEVFFQHQERTTTVGLPATFGRESLHWASRADGKPGLYVLLNEQLRVPVRIERTDSLWRRYRLVTVGNAEMFNPDEEFVRAYVGPDGKVGAV